MIVYQYEAFDRLDTITDPQGNVVDFDYDQRGRRTLVSDPDSGDAFSFYNGYGELRGKLDSLNHTTAYHRDVVGRVYQRIDSDVIDDADAFWFTGSWRF